MVNLKKGGKQAKKEDKSTAEKSKEIVNKASDNEIQEATKQPVASRDTRNKAATKTTEAPERTSRRGEKESEMEEKMEEPTEEMSDKKSNGRKRKADEKESEDVKEKESKPKKSKQAKGSAAGSEDQNSENGMEEIPPENEPATSKTQKGRKTAQKKNAEEMDTGSEMSSEKASSSGDKVAEEVQTAKRGRGAQKGKVTENSEDAEVTEKVADKAKGKGAKKGAKDTGSALGAVDDDTTEAEPPKKKARVASVVSHSSHRTAAGVVLTVGEGDTGQLGLGPDVQERGKPGKVEMPTDAVQVCAGGMHSVCLTANGEVYTFGCNDEGSLGRPTKEEEDCMEPGKVDLPEKVVLVSAGDSHSAALSEFGQVYIWGTFRDANGSIGIFPDHGKVEKPEKILPNVVVAKIASGCDHLVCLTTDGDIYTMGAAEQGQLGRVAECFSVRGGRKGLELLLVPSMVKCNKRKEKFVDIWTGQYVTFAKAKGSGEIYAWGLNNYYQLGFPDMRNKFVPEKSKTFEKSKDWKEISSGQHHTVALDKDGLVYSLGRKEYGRLGLGSEDLEEKSAPTLIASLQDKKCVNVNCGSVVSFAVDDEGKIYGWGMGSIKQLAQGDDEEDIYEPKHITSKQLDDKRGLMVSAGGQHTIFLAQNRS